VPLREVLLRCGVKRPADGANHVCFVGVEKMPKGRYGTSINWFTAMDPACDVMLAYEQNGERLTPDHGHPLRLIIPGYIGGRMIKWLNEITVTTEESDNFFHFNDNRVLPEHVTAEIANAEGWWYKPDYIINELNINSAIARPGHKEVLQLSGKGQKMEISGYCYAGGGRKVIRVEVSLDGGKTWTLTNLTHPEQPTEYGKYWCWCFFKHEVEVSKLWQARLLPLLARATDRASALGHAHVRFAALNAWLCDAQMEDAEILCRGWDNAQTRQPENIVWKVRGAAASQREPPGGSTAGVFRTLVAGRTGLPCALLRAMARPCFLMCRHRDALQA
jgi:DMSO/TMAO reductase YedYZ molybdopterin-dependent catalytic subunit